jgi:hypothetical protein
MSMDLKIEFDESQLAKLMRIPLLMRLAPAERVLKAMAKPVIAKGKAIAPNSRSSGTRAKMSKEASGRWTEEGRNHLGFVYRKTDSGGYLVMGAKDPKGNSLNFDASDTGRKVKYWGKDAGKVKRVEPQDRFMQRAADETRPAQITAGNAQLEIEIRSLNLG